MISVCASGVCGDGAARGRAAGTAQARCQKQINPHFIYNTLNIISAKSMKPATST